MESRLPLMSSGVQVHTLFLARTTRCRKKSLLFRNAYPAFIPSKFQIWNKHTSNSTLCCYSHWLSLVFSLLKVTHIFSHELKHFSKHAGWSIIAHLYSLTQPHQITLWSLHAEMHYTNLSNAWVMCITTSWSRLNITIKKNSDEWTPTSASPQNTPVTDPLRPVKPSMVEKSMGIGFSASFNITDCSNWNKQGLPENHLLY